MAAGGRLGSDSPCLPSTSPRPPTDRRGTARRGSVAAAYAEEDVVPGRDRRAPGAFLVGLGQRDRPAAGRDPPRFLRRRFLGIRVPVGVGFRGRLPGRALVPARTPGRRLLGPSLLGPSLRAAVPRRTPGAAVPTCGRRRPGT